MSKSKQETQDNMRQAIYAAIRRNLFWLGGSCSRHEVVEILAGILSGQLDLIQDEARRQRTN